MRSQLPAAVRDEVAAADGAVRVQPARVSPQAGGERHFETIRRAIADRRKVRCVYDGGKGTADDGNSVDGRGGRGPRGWGDQAFLFRPYALFFGQRAWYAIGHSERAGAERSLKLNRLRSADPTDRPYGIPDGWTVERSLGRAWRMIRGGQRHQVEVRFDVECGRNVADTLWHPTQTVTWEPGGAGDAGGGALRFRCEVDGLDEIVWWVLGYGPHAEVVAPQELRERVKALSSAAAARYAEASPELAGRS